MLKNSQDEFDWNEECEEMFTKFKNFLATPPILTRPTVGAELLVYLSVSNSTISLVLMQEDGKRQILIYFISWVL